MAFSDIIRSVAPTIATALGGPLAGAAVSFLADKLGVSEPTQEKIQQTLSGMTGDQLVQLKKLDIEFQEHMADLGIKIDVEQIEVNKQEASNVNVFVSGWRPAVGWVGAVSLAYAGFFEPFIRFIAHVGFGYDGVFPVIDTSLTMQILVGILGLSGMRSYDKKQGTTNGH